MQNASSNLFKTTGFVRHSVFDNLCGFVQMMKIWHKRDNFAWSVLASATSFATSVTGVFLTCGRPVHRYHWVIGSLIWLAVQAMGTLLFCKHDWLIEGCGQGSNERHILSSFFEFRVKPAYLSCTSTINQSNRISYGAGFFICALCCPGWVTIIFAKISYLFYF